MQSANEIVFYQDENVIIAEVYTIVFDSNDTSVVPPTIAIDFRF